MGWQTGAVTTGAKKSFSWSYSRLKNYEACPKRYYNYDVSKAVKEPESDQLRAGNYVHKILEDRIAKNVPLSDSYKHLEPWALRVINGAGETKVEQQLAITENFTPCAWFDSENPPGGKAWYRAKVDVAKINGPVGMAIDWKTGKILEDSVQLVLTAATMFYHYPQLVKLRTMFVWLAEGDNVKTELDIERSELPSIWSNLWPRIEALKNAHATNDFPPTRNYLCRNWCSVRSCPFHGKGVNEA